jgi:pyruvate dehydrogenase E1 component alpha subunit
MEGHAVHDDASYVPRQLFEEFEARDPLARFRAWLEVNLEVTEEQFDAIAAEVHETIERGVTEAEASPLPDPGTLLEGVYADPTEV